MNAAAAQVVRGALPGTLPRAFSGALSGALVATIVLYQKTLSRALGPRCRFYPSCSQFARECLEKYDLPHATGKITRRLLSCHPFHPGGIDLP